MVCKVQDRAGGDHDGIDGRMRRCSMPALAVDRDPNGVGVRVVGSRSDRHDSGGLCVADVQRHRHVWLGEACEEAIVDHPLGSADGFLGGLADQHQRPVPGIFAARHDFGRAQQRRHVHIVSAGMHHPNVAPRVIFRADFTGVRQASLLFDGERIELSAQHDGWARAVL